MTTGETGNEHLFGGSWTSALANLPPGLLRSEVSQAFKVVTLSSRRNEWQNGFRDFDEINPALGMARQEMQDYSGLPDRPYNLLADDPDENIAKVAWVGLGVVASSLSSNKTTRCIADNMTATDIADFAHSAVDLAYNHWPDAKKLRSSFIKPGSMAFKEFVNFSEFVDAKADQSETMDRIFNKGSLVDSARLSIQIKKSGLAYFLAMAAASGVTHELEPTPTSIVELAQMHKPLASIEDSIDIFNRKGFNVKKHFVGNPLGLKLYQKLVSLNETYEPEWVDIFDSEQLKTQKRAFKEACFGVIDNLCSDRYFKKGLARVNRETLSAMAEAAFKRTHDYAWQFFAREEGQGFRSDIGDQLKPYPLLSSRFTDLEILIARRFTDSVDYDGQPGRFEAMAHAGLTVITTLAWYIDQQRLDVDSLLQPKNTDVL